MDLRPELQIAVMIRAMAQVVLPAVDTGNRPAQEQGHLVLAMLRMLEQRLPLTYRYERDELQRYVNLADALIVDLASADPHLSELIVAGQAGKACLERPGTEPAELVENIAALRKLVGNIAGSLSTTTSRSARVKQLIFEAAKVQIERERAWLLPTGFETVPSSIMPIEEQLKARP